MCVPLRDFADAYCLMRPDHITTAEPVPEPLPQ
jgi:hypothetical protein